MRYILHPDYVTSINDGDRHFISATQLAKLYGVNFHECVVIMDKWSERAYRFQKGDIHLYPDRNGVKTHKDE